MQEGKAVKVDGKSANAAARGFLYLIKFYQNRISPLKTPACRFYPSCSQYMHDAIKKYGLLKGGFAGVKRLLRCHPFNPGGYDPVK